MKLTSRIVSTTNTHKFAFLRALALALALVLACAGCAANGGQPAPTAAPAPTAQITPLVTATPAPTPTPAPDPAELLAALDMEIFGQFVTSDALGYHLALAHPENFAFANAHPGWGEFSYQESERLTGLEQAWLERLRAIDREGLDESGRITYDTLEQYLQSGVDSFQYYYYDEVLNTYNGLHSNLALNLVFYDMHTVDDVEGYLALLEDTPRFMGQVLAFEQEKSAAGLFMSDEMLDEVIGQLEEFTAARETCYLFATFGEAITNVEMSEEQRAAYEARNEAGVNALLDSYVDLAEGLEQLRGTGVNSEGLCGYGEEGKRFFEQRLNDAACAYLTPEDAMELLNAELEHTVSVLQAAAANEPEVAERFNTISLTLGSTEENLAYLKELMASYYPEIPEHVITFMDCPPELESQFSPAAYLIPPVDDAGENLIILNAKTMEAETRYLDTLAHEGYPGHMYHYQYLRTLTEQTGYARQHLPLTGYYEAWSQSAEQFFDTVTKKFSSNYCTFMTANFNISGLLLPSIFSIGVNYEGWTEDDIAVLLAEYFGEEAAAEYKSGYYLECVNNPFYYLEYSLGFCLYQQNMRSVRATMGASYDQKAFNEAYLNIGPTYFNVSLPRMLQWAEDNK